MITVPDLGRDANPPPNSWNAVSIVGLLVCYAVTHYAVVTA